MELEIHVEVRDRHKYVTGLNQLYIYFFIRIVLFNIKY